MSAERPRRLWLGAGAVVAAVLLVTAVLVVRHRTGPKHLETVTDGVLYRSGQLTPSQLADVVDRYGIKTVVNLRSRNEMEQGDWHAREAATLASLDVSLVDLPMHSGHPPDGPSHRAFVDLLADGQATPILVHCEYGVIRTGMMVGVYQIESLGLSGVEALESFDYFGNDPSETIQERIDLFLGEYMTPPTRD